MPDRREAGPHTVSAAPLIAWLDQRLADAGLTRTGDVEEQSVRPWATVLRVPASGGPLWLKATGPEMAFEAGLYELLVRVAPERVLTPIAVDIARGWILLPDGGPTLGDRLRGRELVEAVAHALPRYAELQRAVAPHVDELLAVGVPDMRPARMPERFEEALEAVRGRVDVKPFEALRPTVAEWCARLGDASVPASVDHNDLHAWNVLGAGDDVRFYDWGDAAVAHPFATMLALGWFPMEEADVLRLRDAYLEPFGDLAPHSELVEELELACRVGKIARALTWHRAVSAFGPGEVEERWLSGPAESLLSLLEDTWLGHT